MELMLEQSEVQYQYKMKSGIMSAKGKRWFQWKWFKYMISSLKSFRILEYLILTRLCLWHFFNYFKKIQHKTLPQFWIVIFFLKIIYGCCFILSVRPGRNSDFFFYKVFVHNPERTRRVFHFPPRTPWSFIVMMIITGKATISGPGSWIFIGCDREQQQQQKPQQCL